MISTGTMLPSLMYDSMSSPSAEPLLRSARSRSPAERCTKPYSFTIFSHCVPFPAPGPPRTKMTFGRTANSAASAGAAASAAPPPAAAPSLSPCKGRTREKTPATRGRGRGFQAGRGRRRTVREEEVGCVDGTGARESQTPGGTRGATQECGCETRGGTGREPRGEGGDESGRGRTSQAATKDAAAVAAAKRPHDAGARLRTSASGLRVGEGVAFERVTRAARRARRGVRTAGGEARGQWSRARGRRTSAGRRGRRRPRR